MDKCPYEIEWSKLPDDEKYKKPHPCVIDNCILDPSICVQRLLWAYQRLKQRKK